MNSKRKRSVKDLQVVIQSSISNDALHLIILPTEACNFRCVYCYETFKYNRIKAGVIEGIKNLISIRIPDLKYLHISWFGGEPLLTLDVIENISGHILTLFRGESEMSISSRHDHQRLLPGSTGLLQALSVQSGSLPNYIRWS